MNFLVCDLSLIDRPRLIGPSDRFISYEDTACDANWDSPVHAPISWHSYAAAMNGRIVCAPRNNWREHIAWSDTVLALWNYNPKIAMQAIHDMKTSGKMVIGAFHENGDTFQEHAKSIDFLIDFKHCANACDAMLTYPRHKIYKDIYRSMGITVELIYLPQPFCTDKRKQYNIEPDERTGVFVGPKRKDHEVERRNWIYNIIMAAELVNKEFNSGEKIANRVTTINDSSISNSILKQQLENLLDGCNIEVISPLKYDAYLKTIASHQLTINLDSCDTQGQVDADSMFVGVPLYQPQSFNYRSDFGDLYYEIMSSGVASAEAIESIMTKICTFDKVKAAITAWYTKKDNFCML